MLHVSLCPYSYFPPTLLCSFLLPFYPFYFLFTTFYLFFFFFFFSFNSCSIVFAFISIVTVLKLLLPYAEQKWLLVRLPYQYLESFIIFWGGKIVFIHCGRHVIPKNCWDRTRHYETSSSSVRGTPGLAWAVCVMNWLTLVRGQDQTKRSEMFDCASGSCALRHIVRAKGVGGPTVVYIMKSSSLRIYFTGSERSSFFLSRRKKKGVGGNC